MNHNLRIIISLTIAFLVVNLYGRISSSPFITQIQAENIKGILSNIKFLTMSLNKTFTLKINPQIDNHPVNNNQSSFKLTPIPTKLTNLNYVQPSTMPTIGLSPTSNPHSELFNISTPTYITPKIPTYTSRPTKPPKPTSTPKLPPITTNLRPGRNLTEIFKEVSKRACFPVALLYAFKTVETGERFKNDSATKIKIYNTYGWWKTGAGDPCYGYGYHTQTGIVPEDSINAGTSCNSPIGDPTDLKIMGIIQISEWEQKVAQKYISSILPKTNDRRVLFDNALIFAYISRNRVGNPPKDCNSWPDDMVRLAAKKHLGSNCEYYYSQNGVSGNYCNEILKIYKEYKKKGF